MNILFVSFKKRAEANSPSQKGTRETREPEAREPETSVAEPENRNVAGETNVPEQENFAG